MVHLYVKCFVLQYVKMPFLCDRDVMEILVQLDQLVVLVNLDKMAVMENEEVQGLLGHRYQKH